MVSLGVVESLRVRVSCRVGVSLDAGVSPTMTEDYCDDLQ